jgi:hypothetical protein
MTPWFEIALQVAKVLLSIGIKLTQDFLWFSLS